MKNMKHSLLFLRIFPVIYFAVSCEKMAKFGDTIQLMIE